MIRQSELQWTDARMKTAAELVRSGGVVADIGTDHGYLPIWLLRMNRCPIAVASDIHRGPLEKARENAYRYGVTDRLRLYLSDGLDGIEPEKNGVTDICICGMGGELIADIVTRCAYVQEKRTNLILQPMSSGYELRRSLWQAGFAIEREVLCQNAGRIYTCLQAQYMGDTTADTAEYTEAELLTGRQDKTDPLYPEWLAKHRAAVEKKLRGREMGGLDTTWEKEVLYALETMG